MEYNIEEQRKNALKVLNRYWEFSDDKILDNGDVIDFKNVGDVNSAGMRQDLWIAFALISRGRQKDICRTNAIIRRLEWEECHFSPMVVLQILLRYEDKLETDVKQAMVKYVKKTHDIMKNSSYEFVGVNDNFPCMAAYIAIVGGEYLGDREIIDWGKKSLEKALKMLNRRGLMSEPLSPTYTPIQIMALAEIVNFAKDKEAVENALYIENRIWESVFGFFHYQLGKMAAPYSRAYLIDSVGYVHMIDFLLYVILGDNIPFDAIKEKFDEDRKILHGSVWFEVVQFAVLSLIDYHCDVELIKKAYKRKFPYVVSGTSEYSSSRCDHGFDKYHAIYPAGVAELVSYMTDEYVLSSSTVPFHNGSQTECIYLQYKKKNKIKHTTDIQTVYARYVINDSGPDYNMLWDRGRKISVINDNIAFTAYRPTKSAVGEKITSMKLCIIIPHLSENKPQIVEKSGKFYVHENKTSFVIIPFNDVNDSVIEEFEGFTFISLYNYKGQEKVLTEDNYYKMLNGFCIIVEDNIELEEFIAKEIVFEEKIIQCDHTRDTIMKNIYLYYDGKSIETEYDNECFGIKYCLINDSLKETPLFRSIEL